MTYLIPRDVVGEPFINDFAYHEAVHRISQHLGITTQQVQDCELRPYYDWDTGWSGWTLSNITSGDAQ